MQIELNETGNLLQIIVTGDIEILTVKNFRQRLHEISENTDKEIEIDLSNVGYIDSAGVGVLIELHKLQKKKGKNLIINRVSPKVLNVFKLSSLADIFNLG